MAMVDVVP